MTDNANIITTGTGKEGLWPGSTFYPAKTIAPDALIFSQTSVGGTISGDGPVARIPYIKDGLDAAIVAEGTRITETDPDLSEMYVHTHKIAILTPSATKPPTTRRPPASSRPAWSRPSPTRLTGSSCRATKPASKAWP
ncbi:hypothetical protein [Bifidobacterium asteroides]|uniref:hypothetical protein n=1 Tax=Bifidobacterium asteroides TaxID=1684 RepID=UPI00215D7EA7|nr:hypothetical protein [Bifidobacterium asteroides]